MMDSTTYFENGRLIKNEVRKYPTAKELRKIAQESKLKAFYNKLKKTAENGECSINFPKELLPSMALQQLEKDGYNVIDYEDAVRISW